jgi:hypothetical protein
MDLELDHKTLIHLVAVEERDQQEQLEPLVVVAQVEQDFNLQLLEQQHIMQVEVVEVLTFLE